MLLVISIVTYPHGFYAIFLSPTYYTSYPDLLQIKGEGFACQLDVAVTAGNELVRLAHSQQNIHNASASRT